MIDVPKDEILNDLRINAVVQRVVGGKKTICDLDIGALKIAGILTEDGYRRFLKRQKESPPRETMKQISETVYGVAKALGPAGLMALHHIEPMLKVRFYKDRSAGWSWGDKFGGPISEKIIAKGLINAEKIMIKNNWE